MEQEKKKNNIITLLVLIIVILLLLIIALISERNSFKDKNTSNEGINNEITETSNESDDDSSVNNSAESSGKEPIQTVKIDNNSVDDAALASALDIIGIPYNDTLGNACLNDDLSNANYREKAKTIMSKYIDTHDNISLYRTSNDPRCAESEECIRNNMAADYYGISKENAEFLFKIYNLEGNITDYFENNPISSDDYIFWYGHTITSMFCRDLEINHNLTSEYISSDNSTKDIRITDKQNIIRKESTESRTVIYNFKSDSAGSYFLSSVEVN